MGRPRLFDPQIERTMLVKATQRLLRTHRYGEIRIATILAASGLHTRAFYRHFQTKDDLLVSIYHDNATELGSILKRRVRMAPTPPEAVKAWIDEILRLRFEPHAIEHVAIFDDQSAQEAIAHSREQKRAVRLILEPLRWALEAGIADGTLPHSDARTHPSFMWALAMNGTPPARGRGDRRRAQDQAVEQIFRFCMNGMTGSGADRAARSTLRNSRPAGRQPSKRGATARE